MTRHLTDDQLRAELVAAKPDIVGTTAITASIYKAERVLEIAREVVPQALRVLGGVHATFMYKQVLSEAPHVDVIVRGEGEEIVVDLVRAFAEGRLAADRRAIKGLAFRDGDEIVATPAAPTVKDLDAITPDWSLLDWKSYIYVPLGVRVAIPNMARGCPFTCSFCSQWKFWRDYRIRDPKKVVDEIEALVRDHQVGFFILADEEPTINRKKFTEFCREMIARGLPDKVKWGINTRVTDIIRDKELLALWREGRARPCQPRHGGRRPAEARPVQQGNHGRAEQGGDPPAARGRHLHRGAVHRRHGERDGRDAGGNLPHGLGLAARPRQLVDVHALALHAAVPGARRQGRGVRLRKIQFRHADHEARRHGARRAARPGDEQLPPLLHEEGAVPLSLARHGRSAGAICSAA